MPVNESEIVRRMEVQPAHRDDEPIVGGVRFFRALAIATPIGLLMWIVLIGAAIGTVGFVLELLKGK